MTKTRIFCHILAVVFGLAVFLLISQFVPEMTCRSGWRSPSIGRQGACSWHGGVGYAYFGDKLLAYVVTLTGIMGGVGVWAMGYRLIENVLYKQENELQEQKEHQRRLEYQRKLEVLKSRRQRPVWKSIRRNRTKQRKRNGGG